MLPPVLLAPGDVAARATSTRHWLASLALPAPARAAAAAVIDAVAGGNRRSAAEAVSELASATRTQLDQASVNEMSELARELLQH